jgi:hypothetical protein
MYMDTDAKILDKMFTSTLKEKLYT